MARKFALGARMNEKRLIERCEKYVEFCRDNGGRLPNLAGFFRWLGLTADELEAFRADHSELYRTLLMIFEDEAINSSRPPSLVQMYLKQYLKPSEEVGKSECGPLTLVFDHDIELDGQ